MALILPDTNIVCFRYFIIFLDLRLFFKSLISKFPKFVVESLNLLRLLYFVIRNSRGEISFWEKVRWRKSGAAVAPPWIANINPKLQRLCSNIIARLSSIKSIRYLPNYNILKRKKSKDKMKLLAASVFSAGMYESLNNDLFFITDEISQL